MRNNMRIVAQVRRAELVSVRYSRTWSSRHSAPIDVNSASTNLAPSQQLDRNRDCGEGCGDEVHRAAAQPHATPVSARYSEAVDESKGTRYDNEPDC
jgi:hypothetical protein